MKPQLWRIYAAIGLAEIVGYFALPLNGWQTEVWYDGIGVTAVTAVITGLLVNRPRARRAWILLAVAQAMLSVGDTYLALARAIWNTFPYPSPADLFYAGAYPVLAAALLRLIRDRTPGRNRAALIDAAIVTTGVAAVSWVFVLQPSSHVSTLSLLTRLDAVSQPVEGLLVLAVASRLLFGSRKGSPVFAVVAGAVVLLLCGNAVYAVQALHGTYVYGTPLDLTWLVAYVLWGIAALHPTMDTLSERIHDDGPRLPGYRLALLSAATLLAPATAAVRAIRTSDSGDIVLAAVSAVLFLLVLARLVGVVAGHRDAQEREGLLRGAAARLVSARDVDAMYAVAVETAHALAVGRGRGRAAFAVGTRDQVTIVAAAGDGAAGVLGHEADIRGIADALRGRTYASMTLPAFANEDGDLTAFPLVVHGELLGVMTVRKRGPLGQSVVEALATLGDQLRLALESAALTAELLERQSEERFRSLVQSSSDVIAVLEPDLRLRYHTPSAEHILGYTAEQLAGVQLDALLHPDDRGGFRDLVARMTDSAGRPARREIRIRRRNGDWRTFDAVLNNLLDDPKVHGIVLTAHDVSERIALERQLSYQAFHDPLTGLPNRALLLDRIGHALDRSSRSESAIAVLFIDLDDFKTINDSLGHAAGDELLAATGDRLRGATRGVDTTARLGGDEFAVLLEDLESEEEAILAAERILRAIAEPLALAGREVVVKASIGIALARPNDSVDELLRDADAAMYTAKAAGTCGFSVFEPEMHLAAMRRLELQAELKQAVEAKSFVLHYQPVVVLDSGAFAGFEALVRWEHPQRGLVYPDQFIATLEDTGLITRVGEQVIEEACAAAARWRSLSGGSVDIGVNLSGRQLLDPALAETVRGVLDRSGIPPSSLVLEITESVLMHDADAAIGQLQALKALGVRLAIDDFGTGYSSLEYLRRFPVDILKVAKSFVDDIADDPEAFRLTEAIVRLGHSRGLTLVAEGIETPEQHARLRELRCQVGQGYLFARPLAEADATAFLLAGAAKAA